MPCPLKEAIRNAAQDLKKRDDDVFKVRIEILCSICGNLAGATLLKGKPGKKTVVISDSCQGENPSPIASSIS
jgi:hypothetical protein